MLIFGEATMSLLSTGHVTSLRLSMIIPVVHGFIYCIINLTHNNISPCSLISSKQNSLPGLKQSVVIMVLNSQWQNIILTKGSLSNHLCHHSTTKWSSREEASTSPQCCTSLTLSSQPFKEILGGCHLNCHLPHQSNSYAST